MGTNHKACRTLIYVLRDGETWSRADKKLRAYSHRKRASHRSRFSDWPARVYTSYSSAILQVLMRSPGAGVGGVA